jgi:AcrR family transcriptional regulator
MHADPEATVAIESVEPPKKERAKRGPRRAQRVRRATVMPGAPRGASKQSQRWRLIQAMIELSAKSGYQDVSIADLCAGAGVSPVSFHEHFADKEEALVGACRTCAEEILGEMRSAIAEGEISDAPRRALRALFEAVASDPDAARVLFIEAMGPGERMLEERARALARFELHAAEVLEHAPANSGALDVPASAVVGALRNIVSRDLRNYAEDELPADLDDSLAWLYSYLRAPGTVPWSTSGQALLESSAVSAHQVWRPPRPERLPPGRHALPAGVVARHQRTRLIFATAEATMAKGYANTTVEDIVALARVAKPVFYRYFTDKQHAFLVAQQYPTQYILDRCAEAYFSAQQWPQRMWRHLKTLLELIVANPPISHLRLVECYAAGPQAIRAAEEITRSFTIFLEEGYHYRRQAAALPRLCSRAITGAIFEIIQRQVAAGELAALGSYLPQLTYIAIAPFAGAQEAIALVEEMKAQESAG